MKYYLEIKTKIGSHDGLFLRSREQTASKAEAITKIDDYRDDFSAYEWIATCHYCNHGSSDNTPCNYEILETHTGSTVADTENFLHIEQTDANQMSELPNVVVVTATSKGDATSKYNGKYKNKFDGKTHSKKYKTFVNKKQTAEEDI